MMVEGFSRLSTGDAGKSLTFGKTRFCLSPRPTINLPFCTRMSHLRCTFSLTFGTLSLTCPALTV